jgi:hypothetical protein
MKKGVTVNKFLNKGMNKFGKPGDGDNEEAVYHEYTTLILEIIHTFND